MRFTRTGRHSLGAGAFRSTGENFATTFVEFSVEEVRRALIEYAHKRGAPLPPVVRSELYRPQWLHPMVLKVEHQDWNSGPEASDYSVSPVDD